MKSTRASFLLTGLFCACARTEAGWTAGLDAEDPFERGLSAIGLCAGFPRAAAPAVPPLLRTIDEEASLRAHAEAALAAIAPLHPGALLEPLVTVEGLSPESREALLAALRGAGGPAVAPILAAMRAPGRSNVRELGMLLVAIGRPAVAALVEALRGDPDEVLRRSSAWLLGQMGATAHEAIPALTAALERDVPSVARFAATSLQQVDPEGDRVLDALRQARSRAEPEVREGADRALAEILLARAATAAAETREEAAREMARLGPAALPVAIEAVDAPDPARAEVGRKALGALFASREAAAAARPFAARVAELTHDVPVTRALAALSLADEGEAALGPLSHAAADPHAGVRACAELAIAAIQARAGGPR